MIQFHYKAKKQNAETVVGNLFAESREDAIEKVHQMGLVPVSVEEFKYMETRMGRRVRFGRVTPKERFLFSRQLVSLIKAGVPILRTLDVLARQAKNLYFRDVIEALQTGVRGGMSFSESLAQYPKIFPSLYVTLVKTGEESGRLKEALASIAEYQRQQEEIAAKVRTAFAYPILMFVFGFVSIVFTLTYVMPKISGLYVDLKQMLPLPTQIVMKISAFLLHSGAWLAAGLMVFVFAVKQWLKTAPGRVFSSQVRIHAPFLGLFWLKVEMARFCQAMRLLIQSGVSIVRALQLAIPVVGNELLRQQLRRCQDELVAGRSFGEALLQSSRIPEFVGQLISVGEESGSLGETLGDIAEIYEQDVNEKIKIMTTLLEPLMIVVVGSIVGFIVIAMLLPIFQLDVFAR